MRIVVRNLRKTFRADRGAAVNAVDDLSLDVDDAELLVILGPSGSGKTTLLRCIAGLERADAGEIAVDGKLVYSSAKRVWVPPERRGISMVFQTYALWPHMNVFENVAYPLRVRGVSDAVMRERVAHALQMVGCVALESRHPSEISGGQQQRVAVARAIVGGSRVVLFDEPLSSVDARVREELRHELVVLQRELGFTAVYITHDQTEAMAIGHRVAVLADGKIVQVASPRELYGQPVSGYVAEFMGATNQFSGVVDGPTEGGWRVRTDLGTVYANPAPAGVPASGPVRVILRPEDCRLAPVRPDEANAWQGKVQSSLFLGYCTEYRVRMGELVLSVRSSSKDVALDGSAVWVTIAPPDVRVVAGA